MEKQPSYYRLTYIFIITFLLISFAANTLERKTENLQSIELETFEDNSKNWTLIPRTTFGFDEENKSMQELQIINGQWPKAFFGEEGKFLDKDYKNCLGVKLFFRKQGYNTVDIIPEEPIAFTGRIKMIDLWIWGSNYNYELDCILEDFRGIQHRLNFGRIDFVGWKNLGVLIPNYIPQSVEYIPKLKRLKLIKLVLWSHPAEKARVPIYFYLDHIKYLTDVFEEKFDGHPLAEEEMINKLWKKDSGK